MHWQIHRTGRADYLLADGKLEGGAGRSGLRIPVTPSSGERAAPEALFDEFMEAGFCGGSRSSSCRRKEPSTSRFPPIAEIVLEGLQSPRGGRATEKGRRDHNRLLHAAGESPFPGLHVDRDDDAFPPTRIYPSIVVGKPPREDGVASAGDRADLPGPAIRLERSRDRRLRPAGVGPGGPSTTLHRLDRPRGLPGHGPEGDARDMASGLLQPDQSSVWSWTSGETCTTYAGGLLRVAAKRRQKRERADQRRTARFISTTRPTLKFTAARLGIDADAQGSEGGGRGRGPAGDRDERRGWSRLGRRGAGNK